MTALDRIAAAGLVVGAALGLAGTLVESPTLQASLWAAGLALVSAPTLLPAWLRVLGGVAACLFAVTSACIYAGEEPLPTSAALPFFGYPFLVATLLGWAWMLLRERGRSLEPRS